MTGSTFQFHQGQTASIVLRSNRTTSRAHKASVSGGLERQPKHYHMLSEAGKTMWAQNLAKQVLNEMRSDSLHLQQQLTH